MSTAGKRNILTLKNKRRMPLWIARVLAAFLRLLRRTYRISYVDSCGLLDGSGPWPVVFVLWHNRVLFLGDCFPRTLKEKSAVLISASRDGEYASTVIRQFGLDVVRGSSSRGGYRAAREMMRRLDDGTSIVITMDGPRGPKYTVQPGAAVMALNCHVPVVPISLNASKRWDARSWDGTQIPVPFSKVEVLIGSPVAVNALGSVDRNVIAESLKDALMKLTDDSR